MGIRNTREVASWMNDFENKKQKKEQFKTRSHTKPFVYIDDGGTCTVRMPFVCKG